MGKVVLYVTVSVDGYATGPNDDLRRLHAWAFDDSTAPETAKVGYRSEVNDEFFGAGAYVMGHRTWQSGQEPWGDEEIFPAPVFVLAGKAREVLHQGGTTFTFVTDGPRSALDQAQAVAGDRDVTVMGSPNVAQQFLRAGLFDELRLTQVPVLLGGGVPLFGELGAAAPVELERLSALESGEAVHQWFRVVR